jgi:hypothetical protein
VYCAKIPTTLNGDLAKSRFKLVETNKHGFSTGVYTVMVAHESRDDAEALNSVFYKNFGGMNYFSDVLRFRKPKALVSLLG